MSRRVAQLLAEPEHIVSRQIGELEAKNGYPSHDVRHLAQNVQKVRRKLIDLGLDPDDTTAEELYQALLAKFNDDTTAFDNYYRVVGLGFDEKSDRAISLLNSQLTMPQQWAIKNAAAKKILLQIPPKRIMKRLHYRSVDSLLKRETIQVILLAANQVESSVWQKSFERSVSSLDQTDFEMRSVKLQPLSYKKWSAFRQNKLGVHDNTSATIGLWPSENLIKTPLLTIILLLIEQLDSYQHQDTSYYLSKMGEVVNWWLDMDQLIADFSTDTVSLGLHDTALNALHRKPFQDRHLDHARKSFWRQLVNRYENLPDVDGLFDESVKHSLAKFKIPTPALAQELVEDI